MITVGQSKSDIDNDQETTDLDSSHSDKSHLMESLKQQLQQEKLRTTELRIQLSNITTKCDSLQVSIDRSNEILEYERKYHQIELEKAMTLAKTFVDENRMRRSIDLEKIESIQSSLLNISVSPVARRHVSIFTDDPVQET